MSIFVPYYVWLSVTIYIHLVCILCNVAIILQYIRDIWNILQITFQIWVNVKSARNHSILFSERLSRGICIYVVCRAFKAISRISLCGCKTNILRFCIFLETCLEIRLTALMINYAALGIWICYANLCYVLR